MSIDQNKDVVDRFIMEDLDAGNVDLVDELLAPDYVNTGMGGMDRAGFKGMLPMLAAAIPERRFEVHDLIAEGDAVVARFTYQMTLATGEKVDARGLTYYRLANGKIVEDDPLTSPDLAQVLGPMMQAPAGR